MTQKDFPIELFESSDKEVGLYLSKKALFILSVVPPKEKGAIKTLKRLIRIRKNLFREIEALNKEMRRHRTGIATLNCT